MSERARIASWWLYVLVVVAIFELAMARTNFVYAVIATFIAIVVLGSLLKLIVWAFTRRDKGSAR